MQALYSRANRGFKVGTSALHEISLSLPEAVQNAAPGYLSATRLGWSTDLIGRS